MANWTTAAHVPDGWNRPDGVRYCGAKLAVPVGTQSFQLSRRTRSAAATSASASRMSTRPDSHVDGSSPGTSKIGSPAVSTGPSATSRTPSASCARRSSSSVASSSTSSDDASCAARSSLRRLPAPACSRALAKARCARPFSRARVFTLDLPVLVDDREIGLRHRQGDLPSRLVAADAGDRRLVRGLRRLRPAGRGQHRKGHLRPEGRLRLRLGDLSLEAALVVQDGRRHGAVDRRQEDTAGALQHRLGTQDRLRGPRRVRAPLGRDADRVVEGDRLPHRRRRGDRRHLGG